MKITFLGAAGTVTGSKFLLEADGARILIDCGMFQGQKDIRQRNWERFHVDPASIDAVVLTHAHIDHTGYLPRLVSQGFKGDVFGTPPTCDLAEILLEDSARIQEEDARYANKKKYTRHKPALPLYDSNDAQRAIQMLRARTYGDRFEVGPFRARYSAAGHILGAANLRLEFDGRSIQFSGDIGRPTAPLMVEPDACENADWIVMESTYGNRLHPEGDPIEVLADVVKKTVERDGVLLIPAFAVGRAQAMIYYIDQIFDRDPSLRVPLYLDSPMATDVTKLYLRHAEYHRLSPEACAAFCREATFIRSRDESMELNDKRGPFIIIASSGMLTGGRILHHLKSHGDRRENTILIGGYQAPGTRGADLLDGKDEIKIHGRYHPMRAEVETVSGLSAHGDQAHLLEWLEEIDERPERVFLVHGQSRPAEALADKIDEEYGWDVHIPQHRESVRLMRE